MKKKTPRKTLASIFVVDHGGYPFSVLVAIGASDAEVISDLKSRGIHATDEEIRDGVSVESSVTVEGRFVLLSTGTSVLILRNFNDTPKCWGQLAHEVFHAVDHLFRRIGIGHTDASCEAWAYAIQHLTTAIICELRKHPSKRNQESRRLGLK